MAWTLETFLPTRRSLLIKIKRPDHTEAWQEFYDTYSNLIVSVALKAGLTHVEAQEALQETMISVSKKIAEFDYDPAKGKFKGWLLKLARWRIDDQLRKRTVAHERFHDDATSTRRTPVEARIPDPKGCDLETIWDQEWEQKILEGALERVKRLVSVKQYQIYDLYVLKHMPAEKVSRLLGISRPGIFLAKHRVGKMLAKEVRRLEQR